MSNITPVVPALAAILCLFLISGCVTQPLLSANFDRDDPNTFPDLTLPGDPPGDRMSWTGGAHGSASLEPLEVKNDRAGEPGDKRLRLFRTDRVGEIGPFLGFHARPTAELSGSYSIFWNGEIEYPGNQPSQTLLISVHNTANWHTSALVGLTILRASGGPGDGWTSVNVFEAGSSARRIGFIRESMSYAVLIVVNPETRKYSVVIGGLTANGMLPPDISIEQLSLYLRFQPTDADRPRPGITTYYMDDMRMVQGERRED